jgi:hypothetical protein
MNRLSLRNKPVEVHEFRKFIDHFTGISWIMPQFNTGKPKDVNNVTSWTWNHGNLDPILFALKFPRTSLHSPTQHHKLSSQGTFTCR